MFLDIVVCVVYFLEEAVHLYLRSSVIGAAMGLLSLASTAGAESAPAPGGQGNLLGMLMPLGLFVVIFYFLIIRPQKKKQRKHDEMLSSIRRGDQVVSAGGFFGTVKEVKDDSFIVEIAEGVKARILKGSISMKRSSEDDAALKNAKKADEQGNEKTSGSGGESPKPEETKA